MNNNSLSEYQYFSQYPIEINNITNMIKKIDSFFAIYDMNGDHKNIYLEKEFELAKLNIKYLDNILSALSGNITQIQMLKLYDYIIYQFKRLRIKYEEMETDYFSLDEENKYITNIKMLLEKKEKLTFGRIGYIYLRMNLNNLTRQYELLISISGKNFKLNDYTEEFKKSVYI
jgi:hypothetical protein